MRTVRGLTDELKVSVADKQCLVDELEAVRAKLRASERRAEGAEQERLRTAIEKGDLRREMDEMKEESSAFRWRVLSAFDSHQILVELASKVSFG